MNRSSGMFLIFLMTLTVAAQTAYAAKAATNTEPEFVPVKITDNVYTIYGPLDLPNERNKGFRNNPVIVLTSDGTVILDPGGSAWAGEQVVETAQTLCNQPVVAVFNSHAHGDHWLGNEGVRRSFPEAVIFGHPTMVEKVEGGDGDSWLGQIERLTKGYSGGKAVVAPNRRVKDGDVIKVGDTHFRVHHTGPAHTDNDIMIEVVEEKTLFTGDIVRNGLIGLMESDSSFAGNVSAIDTILSMDVEHYIPGHGPVGGRQVVIAYRTYLDTLLTTVRSLYNEGLADYEMKPTVAEALSAFSGWEGFDMRVGAHISRAFLQVEEEDF